MGVEPTTSWLPVKRSSQLSYIPNLFFHDFQDSVRYPIAIPMVIGRATSPKQTANIVFAHIENGLIIQTETPELRQLYLDASLWSWQNILVIY